MKRMPLTKVGEELSVETLVMEGIFEIIEIGTTSHNINP